MIVIFQIQEVKIEMETKSQINELGEDKTEVSGDATGIRGRVLKSRTENIGGGFQKGRD